MKKKYFYSHIIETSSISLALGEMDLTPQERKHLITLVEANIHQTIVDLILSNLSEDDKKKFLDHMTHDHHEKTWNLLKAKIDSIEGKIQKASEDVKEQLHKDIKEAKSHT
jgi:hypothetical protein